MEMITLVSGKVLHIDHRNDTLRTMPNIEIGISDSVIGENGTTEYLRDIVKLTPSEAVSIIDALETIVNNIGDELASVTHVDDFKNTDHNLSELHPRAERLLEDANVTPLKLSDRMRVIPINEFLDQGENYPEGWEYVDGGASPDDYDEQGLTAEDRGEVIDNAKQSISPVASICTLFHSLDDPALPHGVVEPHGAMWAFATRMEALYWAERIDEENKAWGDRPIDLPFFMTMDTGTRRRADPSLPLGRQGGAAQRHPDPRRSDDARLAQGRARAQAAAQQIRPPADDRRHRRHHRRSVRWTS